MDSAAAEHLFGSVMNVEEDNNDGSAHELLHLVGYNPLAITQATAYISEKNVTPAEHLTAMKSCIKRVLELSDQDPGNRQGYAGSNSSILSN